MSVPLRSTVLMIPAIAAVATLAACTPSTPAASPHRSAPSAARTTSSDLAATSPAASPSTRPSIKSSARPSASAPTATSATSAPGSAEAPSNPPAAPSAATAAPTVPPGSGCATTAGHDGVSGSSITVCPDAAPVGSVVHVTIKGCAPTGAGLPDLPAADLHFLGPDSWLGTNGGGGANVPFSPKTGLEATATFTIPATYTGSEKNGTYPAVPVTPGTQYAFTTDPAGECSVPFTVTRG